MKTASHIILPLCLVLALTAGGLGCANPCVGCDENAPPCPNGEGDSFETPCNASCGCPPGGKGFVGKNRPCVNKDGKPCNSGCAELNCSECEEKYFPLERSTCNGVPGGPCSGECRFEI